MGYIACRRGGGADGNKKVLVTVPIGEDDLFADGMPYRRTDKALGFMANGVVIWIPLSQIEDDDYDLKEWKLRFWAPMWLVEAKSLEIFIDTSYAPGLFGD